MLRPCSLTTPPDEVRRCAFLFLACVLLLLGAGSVLVYSASGATHAERVVERARAAEDPFVATVMSPDSAPADEAVWQDASEAPLRSHGTKVLVGLALLVTFASVDYRVWRRWVRVLYLGGLVLLGLVFVPGIGHDVNGAHRWLDPRFVGFAVQPSEFAKLAVILLVASLLATQSAAERGFVRGFCPLAGAILVPTALILVETDFGTGFLVAILGFGLLMLDGCRLRHLGALAVLGAPFVAVLVSKKGGYALDRLSGFQDPEPSSQLGMTLSCLREGGLFGVGLGEGRAKLFFLSEIEDDFILALVGEELGFVGVAAILGTFALMLWSGVRVLFGVRDRFGFFVVAGVLLTLAMQASINLAVSTGLVPVKGMPLPFVSAGGSSLTMLCVAAGLVWSVGRVAAVQAEEAWTGETAVARDPVSLPVQDVVRG